MKKFFAIVQIIILTFFVAGCTGKNSPENQTITYNLENEPKSLDPQVANDYSSNILIMNLFEGLTRIKPDGTAGPGVAYKWDNNEDFTSFTFYLRENATWSDKSKTPVSANDFVYGVQRALYKGTCCPLATSLYCIKNAKDVHINGKSPSNLGVFALDDHTIKIELEYPNKDLPKLVSTAPTMPCNSEFFESSAGQYGLEIKTVMGNGPFKIKNKYGWNHFHSISLVRNNNYKGETAVVPAGINFSIGKDMSNSAQLIKDGAIDAGPLGLGQLNFAKEEEFELVFFKDTVWGLSFNVSNPVFSNLNVRKAFITAIDRQRVASMVPDNCTVTNSIVIGDLLVNGNAYGNVCPENLYMQQSSAAKDFLNTGLSQLNLKQIPQISILCLDTPQVKSIVSTVIENLNSGLNYHFNMIPVTDAELKSKIFGSTYQIAFAPLLAQSDSALEFLEAFKSTSDRNIANLKSVEYDKILEKAAVASPSDTEKLLVDAEKYLHNNAIFYPLYLENRYFACSKNVTGILFHKYKRGIDFLNAKKVK